MIDLFEYPASRFPDDFLFGAATAGQQIEGNNKSYHDDPRFQPERMYTGAKWVPAGKAADSYNRYEEDIDLLKQLHLNSYRMSIEWARIEPEEGCFDEKEIEHYRTILQRLKEEGISTIVTLHHVSHPVWFHEKNAFETMDNLPYFLRYVDRVVPEYKDLVDYWLVLNELNIPFEYSIQERTNMLQYHAHAYHHIKAVCDTPVSSTLSYAAKQPYRQGFDEPDALMAKWMDWNEIGFFLHAVRTGEIVFPYQDAVYCPQLKDSMDFWAVNIYVRHLVNSRKAWPIADHYTATHFKALQQGEIYTEEIHPDIMIEMLMRLKDKPVFITENGMATDNEKRRMEYIAAMLTAIKQGMDMGANVIGYLHWSLLDNWEWGSYEPLFGLASVGEDGMRTLKKGALFYGDIAKEKALTPEIIRKHYQ
jgi:beta-glucosidase